MAAQADSAPPPAGADLNWLWRIALVGGLTIVVVLVWALREPQPVLQPQPTAAQPAAVQPTSPPAAATPAQTEPAAAPAQPLQPTAEPAPTIAPPAPSGIIPGRPDPPAPPQPHAFERYLVQRGETLILIAALRGVALNDLLLFNPELGDGSILQAGAQIWIPIWEAPNDDSP